MAGRGPAPKDPAKRVRGERSEPQLTGIASDGRARGPLLKDSVFGISGAKWHAQTRAFWDSWRRSAQARTFTQTDWDNLLDTALLHHTMWTTGKLELASEIRLRVAKFGATPEDRMRLRISVDTGGGAAPESKPKKTAATATVTSLSSRKARLT